MKTKVRLGKKLFIHIPKAVAEDLNIKDAKGMNSPSLNTFMSKISLSDVNDDPPQLNGTVGGATIISLH